MASQLSTLTYVNTLNLRATNIEFSDVGTSGATDLNMNKQVQPQLMSYNAIMALMAINL